MDLSVFLGIYVVRKKKVVTQKSEFGLDRCVQ
jgi:hypothetical protein